PHEGAEAKKVLGLLTGASWSSPVTIAGVRCVTVVHFSQTGTCSQSTYRLGPKGKVSLVATTSGLCDVDGSGILRLYPAGILVEAGKVSVLGKDQWSYEILDNLFAPRIAGTRLTFTREP